MLDRLSGANETQKEIIDTVASKLVRVLYIARQQSESVEPWDEVIRILKEERSEVPANDDDLQTIIDYHIKHSANSIARAIAASDKERKKMAFMVRETKNGDE